MDRVEFGRTVSRRLSQAPGVARIPVDGLDLFVSRDFLSPAECDGLMRQIDAGRKPSRLMAKGSDPTFRTSETCNLDPADPLVRAVEARIFSLIGIDPRNGEYLQGQRYAVGQQFKMHHDYLSETGDYWPRQKMVGGQRTWTAMAFLNVPEKGGATHFGPADILLPPRRGTLVTWNNLDDEGAPNPRSRHAGMPVEAGFKYVITKWFRERPWGPPKNSRQMPEA